MLQARAGYRSARPPSICSNPACNARPVHTKVPTTDSAGILATRSPRVLASPISHGTHNRAEVATLLGQHVLGPRGTHRIEPPLHDAILLERPETLRQCRWSDALQRVLQVLKASRTMLEEIAQDEASPARSNDAECVGHRAFGRRGRPSAALVQPSITRYSARLKRLPHPASNVRTDECRLRVKMRRTHLEHNESAFPPLTDMTADMLGIRLRPCTDSCTAAKSP